MTALDDLLAEADRAQAAMQAAPREREEVARLDAWLAAAEEYEEAREAAEAEQQYDPREAHRRLDERARHHWESQLSSERRDHR